MQQAMTRLDFHSVTALDPGDPATERHRRRYMPAVRILLLCAVAALLTAGGRVFQQVEAAKIVPEPVDVDRHLAAARKLGQRVIVYFTDHRVDDAVRMNDSWDDVRVAELVERNYRFVRLDPAAPNYRSVLDEHGLPGAPAMVVMSSTGKVLSAPDGTLLKRAGYIDAESLSALLDVRATRSAPRGEAAMHRRLDEPIDPVSAGELSDG